MSKRDWKLFVEDILESIELIAGYCTGMQLDDFIRDRKTADAVVRNLEIIGEASKYIPDEVKVKYPNIDWKAVIGLRNRISHDYFGISLRIVCDIIKKELPALAGQMKLVLEND